MKKIKGKSTKSRVNSKKRKSVISGSSDWTHIEEFFKSIGKPIKDATKEVEGTTWITLSNKPQSDSDKKKEED